MIGIPPPTLASNAMHVLCLRAKANRSGPRSAKRLLFAVMTGLPTSSAFDQVAGSRCAAHCFNDDLDSGVVNRCSPVALPRGKRINRGVFLEIANDDVAEIETKARPRVEQVLLRVQDLKYATANISAAEHRIPTGKDGVSGIWSGGRRQFSILATIDRSPKL